MNHQNAIASFLPITANRILADVRPDAACLAALQARNPGLTLFGPETDGRADVALLIGGHDLAARLKALAPRLTPEGCCVILTANRCHYRRLEAWLTGAPEPAADDPGISRDELAKALEAAGLRPGKLRSLFDNRETAQTATETLVPFARRLGLEPQALADRVAPAAFLAQTRPRTMQGRPISMTGMTLGSKPDAMAILRMGAPLVSLSSLTDFAVGAVAHRPPIKCAADGTKNDILVWQRPILTDASKPGIDKIISTHHVFVLEFDDHPMRWPEIAENGYLNFLAPHALRTSTETLASILREFNPNVFVSPNQIETLPAFRPVEARKGPLRLLFAALNRKDDWAPEIEAVNRVLKRFPAGTLAVDVVFDRQFFDAVEVPDKHFHPMLPYEAYKALLATADIAWLPLADTLFNRCKSDLKFIECAAYGVAALASPVLYDQTIRDGETGLIYRSQEALEAGLAALIEDADLRARLVRAAYDEIAATRLRVHHLAREADWYRSLLKRRDALEAERKARMARLAPVG